MRIRLFSIGITILFLSFSIQIIGQSKCGQPYFPIPGVDLPNSCPIIEQPQFSDVGGTCTITFVWNKCSSNNNCLFWCFDQDGDFTIQSLFPATTQACSLSGGQDDGDCAGGEPANGGLNPNPPTPAFCTENIGGDIYGTIKVGSSAIPDECRLDTDDFTIINVLVVTYSGPCANVPNFTFTWETYNSGNCNGGNCDPSGASNWVWQDEDVFNIPAPVSFGKLAAKKNNNVIELTWNTFSEINNQGFEIQRSTDGRNFHPIGFVNGQGNSSKEELYSYIDRYPFSGDNIYRLKQMDFDGRYEFSPLTTARIELSRNLSVYPNPGSSTSTTLHISTELLEMATIGIFSIDGKKVYELHADLNAGENLVDLSIANLKPGVYFARMTQENEVLQTKFVIQ